MTILSHEIRRGTKSLIIWTAAITALLGMCIALFPQMKEMMGAMSEEFSKMGAFAEQFNAVDAMMGDLGAFYAVEATSMLGLGGSLFAAFCAVDIVSKEQHKKTADFLLTHPVSRIRILTEKLISVIVRIVLFDLIVYGCMTALTVAVGESVPDNFLLLHLVYMFMHIEFAGISFALSSWLSKSGVGFGIGLVMGMFFLQAVANMMDRLDFLNYITPFGYCKGNVIISSGEIEWVKILIGMLICAAAVVSAYIIYPRKDIT